MEKGKRRGGGLEDWRSGREGDEGSEDEEVEDEGEVEVGRERGRTRFYADVRNGMG